VRLRSGAALVPVGDAAEALGEAEGLGHRAGAEDL
jgi:hypothetical protein